jgi:predicted kinase
MADDAPLTLIVLVGLQGAGKSTFFRRHFEGDYAHISMDLLRNNRHPARRQLQLLREALSAGRSAVADNTNPTLADRAALIALGREFGARVVGYFFEPDVRGSLARNREREGKARVPDVAIFATRKKLQAPSRAEGFDELYAVRLGPDGGFEVRPLEDPADEAQRDGSDEGGASDGQ